MLARPVSALVLRVLRDYGKMAFLSGPRQVGKTTLAQGLRQDFGQSLYFNWDIIADQKRLQKDPYFFEQEDRDPREPFLVILDEIHKYARWKNYLKGAFDRYREEFRFLVTGSGRLDIYKRGGESLLGRYMSVPLYPLSLGEVLGRAPTWEEFKSSLADPPAADPAAAEACETLFRFSGFPEPFVRAEAGFYQMWFQETKTLLIREDIRSASNIREISLLELLSHMIPERIGAPLSVNSLREELGVAFETVRDWLLLLERFYYLTRISPYSGSLSRTLRKEQKAYLFNWVEVPEEPHRFENMVALHLAKAVALWRAAGQGDIGLHYIRDKEKREVDFVLAERRRPACLIECKWADEELSPSLLHFQGKLGVPTAVQLVRRSGTAKRTSRNKGVQWVLPADRWLAALP